MLSILLEEAGLVAVDKPSGLDSTGRTLADTACVQYQLGRQLGRRVWAVHQLDRGTSGVNLFVTRGALVQVWQARLADPMASKRYLALCHGRVAEDEQAVDAPIGGERDGLQWWWRVRPDGKPARSEVQVLARGPAHTLVAVRLLTGRTHQVRIHMAHLGYPLVGEGRYREPPCTLAPYPALHAWQVRFAAGVRPDLVRAPVPAPFLGLVEALGMTWPSGG
jgi:23S rRNA-/tRNA-specific pseudouridylate synthase